MRLPLRAAPLAVLTFLLLDGAARTEAAPAPPAPPRLPAVYAEPELVALPSGRRLAFYCVGQGSPTVVFEAGAGNEAAIWSKVQPAIAKQTRTCSYDRAGYGASDLDRGPRDAERVSTQLYEGLQAKGEAGPYLLVGHSLGGFYLRMFATRHREEVAGMVLVDPMINGGHAPLIALAPTYGRYVAAIEASYERCLRPTARGEMGPTSPLYAACGSPRPGSPQADPKRAEASLLEQAGMAPSSEEVVKAQVPFGDLPLIVLSRDPLLDGGQAWPAAEREAYRRAWTEGHRAIAALSTRGAEREVKGADHGIHQTRPEAVIEAVEQVLKAAREGMGKPAPSSELPGEGRGPDADRPTVSASGQPPV